MADWSPAIANEFIRRAAAEQRAYTQMQLQKLVYIASGWNLAINGQPLTYDPPEAWEYGPVYRELRNALRNRGSEKITREIQNADFVPGAFTDDPDSPATAALTPAETAVIDKVFAVYGKYHAFQLSALTHQPGTPWSEVFQDGRGKSHEIPAGLIRDHFVQLAAANAA